MKKKLITVKLRMVSQIQVTENVNAKPSLNSDRKFFLSAEFVAGGWAQIKIAKLMKKVAASTAKATGGPRALTSKPPAMGPITRLSCRARPRNELAATRISFGTTSGMIALIAGR